MGNSDYYRIVVTVQGTYEDKPRRTLTHGDFLAPDQDGGEKVAIARQLRSFALHLAPEDAGARSSMAIAEAVHDVRQRAGRELEHVPATRDVVLGYVDALAELLGDG